MVDHAEAVDGVERLVGLVGRDVGFVDLDVRQVGEELTRDVRGVQVEPDHVLGHCGDATDVLPAPASGVEDPLAREVVDRAGLDPVTPEKLLGLLEVLPLVLPLELLGLGVHGAHYGSRFGHWSE